MVVAVVMQEAAKGQAVAVAAGFARSWHWLSLQGRLLLTRLVPLAQKGWRLLAMSERMVLLGEPLLFREAHIPRMVVLVEYI